jgi:aspartate ammonia-lyase
MVKLAAARANFECGQFSRDILTGIEKACAELMDGKLHDQFRLDVFQGGAGTSTNMNANEVIANRALELMGHKKGQYEFCNPHDHANASQSTNDAYPTSLHVGMLLGNRELIVVSRCAHGRGQRFIANSNFQRLFDSEVVPQVFERAVLSSPDDSSRTDARHFFHQ